MTDHTTRHWLLTPEADAAFRARHGRPAPWCEPVTADDLETLALAISRHLRLPRPIININDLLREVWNQMPGRKPADNGAHRGGTEPLDQAAARFGLPSDGAAILIDDLYTPIRLRTKDVIAFNQSLWHGHGQVWLIDDDAKWLIVGTHDWPAYFWRFPKPPA